MDGYTDLKYNEATFLHSSYEDQELMYNKALKDYHRGIHGFDPNWLDNVTQIIEDGLIGVPNNRMAGQHKEFIERYVNQTANTLETQVRATESVLNNTNRAINPFLGRTVQLTKYAPSSISYYLTEVFRFVLRLRAEYYQCEDIETESHILRGHITHASQVETDPEAPGFNPNKREVDMRQYLLAVNDSLGATNNIITEVYPYICEQYYRFRLQVIIVKERNQYLFDQSIYRSNVGGRQDFDKGQYTWKRDMKVAASGAPWLTHTQPIR